MKPKKPKIIWWRGHTAEIIRQVLAMDDPDIRKTQHPGELYAKLNQLRAVQIPLLGELLPHCPSITEMGWNQTLGVEARMRACPSVLRKNTNNWWCDNSWFCPNCYGREIWTLIRFLQDIPEPMTLETESVSIDHYRGMAPLWEDYKRVRRSELRKYPSSLVWQFIAPTPVPEDRVVDRYFWYKHTAHWTFRRVLIRPGESTAEQILRKLPGTLYYPWSWLMGDIRTVACAMGFMGQVRGRSLAGAWKKLKGSIEDLPF